MTGSLGGGILSGNKKAPFLLLVDDVDDDDAETSG